MSPGETAAAQGRMRTGHSDPTAREVRERMQLSLVDAEIVELLVKFGLVQRPETAPELVAAEAPAANALPAHDVYALDTGAEIRAHYSPNGTTHGSA